MNRYDDENSDDDNSISDNDNSISDNDNISDNDDISDNNDDNISDNDGLDNNDDDISDNDDLDNNDDDSDFAGFVEVSNFKSVKNHATNGHDVTFDFYAVDPTMRLPQFQRATEEFRHAILDNIETNAINHVTIYINQSNQIDELLVERLGMIPLKRLDNTVNPEIFELGVIADKNKERIVMASDLISTKNRIKPCVNVPIARLPPGRALALRAKTVRGTKLAHGMFASSSVAGGEYVTDELRYLFRIEFECQHDPKEIIEDAMNYIHTPDMENVIYGKQSAYEQVREMLGSKY